ncbi:hypothetical protein PR048_000892 [Dryococelus australis]|uniref:Uncharacterized protein n=1 Tax=Dryococelus australis TaxID=614101 RepID=A0ABQ9IFX4_9NEOP|nr:hypothetical protein PR048_000892 [Dryococelus australis]
MRCVLLAVVNDLDYRRTWRYLSNNAPCVDSPPPPEGCHCNVATSCNYVLHTNLLHGQLRSRARLIFACGRSIHNVQQWRVVKCCKVSWCLLSAVHTRRTQQEPVIRAEPGETDCIATLTRVWRGTHYTRVVTSTALLRLNRRCVNYVISHISDDSIVSRPLIVVQSPAGSLPDFRMWESCRTMTLFGEFSRGSTLLPHPYFRYCSILRRFTPSPFKTSLLRAAQISSLTLGRALYDVDDGMVSLRRLTRVGSADMDWKGGRGAGSQDPIYTSVGSRRHIQSFINTCGRHMCYSSAPLNKLNTTPLDTWAGLSLLLDIQTIYRVNGGGALNATNTDTNYRPPSKAQRCGARSPLIKSVKRHGRCYWPIFSQCSCFSLPLYPAVTQSRLACHASGVTCTYKSHLGDLPDSGGGNAHLTKFGILQYELNLEIQRKLQRVPYCLMPNYYTCRRKENNRLMLQQAIRHTPLYSWDTIICLLVAAITSGLCTALFNDNSLPPSYYWPIVERDVSKQLPAGWRAGNCTWALSQKMQHEPQDIFKSTFMDLTTLLSLPVVYDGSPEYRAYVAVKNSLQSTGIHTHVFCFQHDMTGKSRTTQTMVSRQLFEWLNNDLCPNASRSLVTPGRRCSTNLSKELATEHCSRLQTVFQIASTHTRTRSLQTAIAVTLPPYGTIVTRTLQNNRYARIEHACAHTRARTRTRSRLTFGKALSNAIAKCECTFLTVWNTATVGNLSRTLGAGGRETTRQCSCHNTKLITSLSAIALLTTALRDLRFTTGICTHGAALVQPRSVVVTTELNNLALSLEAHQRPCSYSNMVYSSEIGLLLTDQLNNASRTGLDSRVYLAIHATVLAHFIVYSHYTYGHTGLLGNQQKPGFLGESQAAPPGAARAGQRTRICGYASSGRRKRSNRKYGRKRVEGDFMHVVTYIVLRHTQLGVSTLLEPDHTQHYDIQNWRCTAYVPFLNISRAKLREQRARDKNALFKVCNVYNVEAGSSMYRMQHLNTFPSTLTLFRGRVKQQRRPCTGVSQTGERTLVARKDSYRRVAAAAKKDAAGRGDFDLPNRMSDN